jgi:Maltokinase N-terminal cap domain
MAAMAVIHKTTMAPTKLELLTPWLPAQPWYAATNREPELYRAGGFRLDDPEGEVGIEFMVVRDDSGDRPGAYHVPLTYRGAPLDGADEAALIGTSEHGVLGRRWVYDGTHDPVLVTGLIRLLQGREVPQAQSLTDTPDPSVTVSGTADTPATVTGPAAVTNGPHGTDLRLTADTGPLVLRVARVLTASPGDDDQQPCTAQVTAPWRSPDDSENRSRFAALYRA